MDEVVVERQPLEVLLDAGRATALVLPELLPHHLGLQLGKERRERRELGRGVLDDLLEGNGGDAVAREDDFFGCRGDIAGELDDPLTAVRLFP